MYFCPHPRRYGGGNAYRRGRQQITPLCARPPTPPILHPPPTPPPIRPLVQPLVLAPIPPLPQACNNDATVNVQELLENEEEKKVNEKGKGKWTYNSAEESRMELMIPKNCTGRMFPA